MHSSGLGYLFSTGYLQYEIYSQKTQKIRNQVTNLNLASPKLAFKISQLLHIHMQLISIAFCNFMQLFSNNYTFCAKSCRFVPFQCHIEIMKYVVAFETNRVGPGPLFPSRFTRRATLECASNRCTIVMVHSRRYLPLPSVGLSPLPKNPCTHFAMGFSFPLTTSDAEC